MAGPMVCEYTVVVHVDNDTGLASVQCGSHEGGTEHNETIGGLTPDAVIEAASEFLKAHMISGEALVAASASADNNTMEGKSVCEGRR